jgi:DHA1 family multidrug resistance protein-like MFS transporter
MYIPLSYPQFAASLFAANDFARSALASGAILFARPLYLNLGVGQGISLLAGLTVGCIGGIFGLYFFGAKLRARSKFTAK